MADGEARKKRTVNGVTRSLIFTKDQDARLNRLLEATEMNRNQFFRLCATQMTPTDVSDLRRRTR